MSPLRWDVLLVGFALALPVLALGLRGDLSTEEMMTRVLWCLGAGWVVVALFRLAISPSPSAEAPTTTSEPGEPADHSPAV